MGQDRVRSEPAEGAAVQPGAMLRAARERLNLGLEALEEKTKIRRSFLQALEEGRYERLPGPVYTRAFLKLYAHAVGLDPGDVLTAYERATGRQALAAQASRHAGRSRPWWRPDPLLQALEPQRRLRALAGATVMVVLGALAGAWLLSSATEPRRREADRILSAEAPPGGPNGVGSGQQPGTAAATTEEKSVAALTGQAEPAPLPSREGASAAGAPASPSLPPPASVRVPGAPGAGVEVVARVVERSWIEAYADGQEVFSGTAEPGEVLSWRADKVLSVRFGNAEGVELVVDGVPRGRAGRGVVTRHFFAEQQQPRSGRP